MHPDIREREDRAYRGVGVPGARDLDEGRVRERHAHLLTLTAVDAVVAEAAAVEAVRLPAGATQHAGAVGPRERRDDGVAGGEVVNVAPDLLDDAHELVADCARVMR